MIVHGSCLNPEDAATQRIAASFSLQRAQDYSCLAASTMLNGQNNRPAGKHGANLTRAHGREIPEKREDYWKPGTLDMFCAQRLEVVRGVFI